jgi:uroporphyrinogen decarboxylase
LRDEGTEDQAPARLLAMQEPELFQKIIDRLVDASAAHLIGQMKAGAEAVQIFDTWAGVLDPVSFERWCVKPVAKIARKVRAAVPNARMIVFPKGASLNGIEAVAKQIQCECGRDRLDCRSSGLAVRFGDKFAIQGNLDPLALIAGGKALDEAVDNLLAGSARRAAYLQSRSWHPEGNADRACRADDPARVRKN